MMTVREMTLVLAMLLCGGGTSTQLHAADNACTHCGSRDSCCTVCRLVCEEKKVNVAVFGCQREQFCVPGPSQPECQHCKLIDANAGVPDKDHPVSTVSRRFVWTQWIPGCAEVHTRKKLMKRTISQTIPNYRWVVETVCPSCQAGLVIPNVAADIDLPPQPVLGPGVHVLAPPVALRQFP